MRPTSIVAFELLFLLSTLMSIPGLYRSSLQASWLYGGVGIVIILLLLALVLAVSRRRSRAAKWALVAFLLFGLVVSAGEGSAGWTAFEYIETALSVLAVGLLFTASARQWLAPDKALDGAGGRRTPPQPEHAGWREGPRA